MRSNAAIVILAVALVSAPARAAASDDSIVLRWSAATLEAIRQSTLPPPAVARALAIVHTCIYDAWAAYDPVAEGVHFRGKAEPGPGGDPVRAISYAAHRALMDLFPDRASLFDVVMQSLGYDPTDLSDPGSLLGRNAAEAGLSARRDDGSNQLRQYADYTGYAAVNTPDVLTDPNRWQPLRTASGAEQAFSLPQWGRVAPFALVTANQFQPPPPSAFPHGSYRKQALEILHMSAHLTDRQKAIAEYWADGPRTETPPGHWCLIAEFVSRRDGYTLEQDVKLFFMLANALMDASIAVWDAKVYYDSARPVTAIRFLFGGRPVRAWAGPYQGTQLIDGSTWTSYIATPPFAEFVSGHSAFSAASAEILRRFTGSDDFGGEVTIAAGSSPVEPGLFPRQDVTLSWPAFSDAADEAGLSRRYGGIHFEAGDLEGRTLGRRIAAIVWEKAASYFNGGRSATEAAQQERP
jgi:hypothetical protein